MSLAALTASSSVVEGDDRRHGPEDLHGQQRGPAGTDVEHGRRDRSSRRRSGALASGQDLGAPRPVSVRPPSSATGRLGRLVDHRARSWCRRDRGRTHLERRHAAASCGGEGVGDASWT